MSYDALIFDGKALACRQYYGSLKDLEAPDLADGLLRLMRRMANDLGANLWAVAWESGDLYRREMSPEYKANRKPHPDDLRAQLHTMPERLAQHAEVFALEGYEADDVMATCARALSAFGNRVGLVTRDKDLLACVGPLVHVVFPGAEGYEITDANVVRAEWGVEPAQIPDVLAIMGDASDNVPGVPGLGMKGATEIIAAHGSLGVALECVDTPGTRVHLTAAQCAKLRNGRDSALLSLELVTLNSKLPLTLDLGAMAIPPEVFHASPAA